MSLNLNKVILAGRLTKDSELRTTPSGTPVTQFDIAVNRRGAKDGQQPQTDFITVVAWRQTAEFITRYFKKGNAICVVGSIQTRSYTDKNNQKRTATEVVAMKPISWNRKQKQIRSIHRPQATPRRPHRIPHGRITHSKPIRILPHSKCRYREIQCHRQHTR